MSEKTRVTVSQGNLVDISTIDKGNAKKTTIMYKINIKVFIFGIVFIAFLCAWNNIARIVGGVFTLVMLYIYFRIPDTKVMEIYDDEIIIYDTDVEGKAIRINMEDIDAYTNSLYEEGFDLLVIRTIQGDAIFCETYESTKATRRLKKLIPDKELRSQQLDAMREETVFRKKKEGK